MKTTKKRFFTPRVLVISILVWVVLCLLTIGSLLLTIPSKSLKQAPTAFLTLIYNPTVTVTSPAAANVNETPGIIHIGSFVKITGTEGDGLRIRSGPGMSNMQKFYGQEGEIFEVKDGPVSQDGYTWWYIISAKDQTRVGWAAGNFLTLTDKP